MDSIPKPEPKSESVDPKSNSQLLGLPTSEIAGLTVDEIINNKTAITMLLHYYKAMLDENQSLKNDINTLRGYYSGFERKLNDVFVSSFIGFLGNIFIGFGVNLLTGSTEGASHGGWLLLIAGIISSIGSIYLANRKE